MLAIYRTVNIATLLITCFESLALVVPDWNASVFMPRNDQIVIDHRSSNLARIKT